MIPRIENVNYNPDLSPVERCKECNFLLDNNENDNATELGLCDFHYREMLKKSDEEFSITVHTINEEFFSTVTDHSKIVFTSRKWNYHLSAYAESAEWCADKEYYGFEKLVEL